jgi:RNA polymerase sigma-70 factor (ECF subfamily)
MGAPSDPTRPASATSDPHGRACAADNFDLLIVRVAEHGDRDAFRTLFLSLSPKVKALAIRQGADPAGAEEIVQETFLAVWRKARQFSPQRGGAGAWVFAIARNIRIDLLRRQPAWQALTEEQEESDPSNDCAPDDALASRQIQSRVQGVVLGLPPDQAAVVRLSYVDGLSHSEIAGALGVPLGTVKTRMNLAYQKIRTALQDCR